MEFQNKKAIWQQIAHQIATRILGGEWKAEERIPSVRDTAAEIQVNPNTVVRSYNFLQEVGIIYNQRGRGYFVAEDGVAQAKNLRKKTFLQDVLPTFFSMMDELDIPWADVQKLYKERKA